MNKILLTVAALIGFATAPTIVAAARTSLIVDGVDAMKMNNVANATADHSASNAIMKQIGLPAQSDNGSGGISSMARNAAQWFAKSVGALTKIARYAVASVVASVVGSPGPSRVAAAPA